MSLVVPALRESVMTERRLAPLTALTTLTRRPARVRRAHARGPGAPPPPPAGPVADGRQRRLLRGTAGRDAGDARPRAARSWRRGRTAWPGSGSTGRSRGELGELAELYDLPELAVEDAIKAHQRPKFERYGDTLFVVLKAARYLDAAEEVEFGELHLFLGADFVITVRHSESPDLSRVRRRLESEPELLAKGSEAVLYAILDAVVDGYGRWSPAWPTTSTRSRPRSSAATRGCRGASTSCRRRCWSSSGPPSR